MMVRVASVAPTTGMIRVVNCVSWKTGRSGAVTVIHVLSKVCSSFSQHNGCSIQQQLTKSSIKAACTYN